MLIRITSALLLTLCSLTTSVLYGQRVAVAVEPIEHFDPYFEEVSVLIEDFVTRELTNNRALRVVERTDFTGITNEQERQKNEGFIDGETVDQGKLVGARLLVRFNYNEDAGSLRLQVVDLATNEILCSESYATEVNTSGTLPQAVWDRMTSGLQGCFQQFSAPAAAPLQVVEILPETAGDIMLLVYAEDTKSIRVGTRISLYTVTKKMVGSKEVDYTEEVGELIVKEIENKHFLNGTVSGGEAAVRTLLTEKSEVYARPVQ